MRKVLKSLTQPRSDHATMIGDALGALALFAMAYAALHLPLMA